MRSAVPFQNVPHKDLDPKLYHVKTTIQIRNGNNGRHLRCYHEWRPARRYCVCYLQKSKSITLCRT
uniref:Uncharacterized protein n=1 Tax=uncultured marine thaumarchaeote AD1000_96_F07 TaxID=1455948 RepID=A0A075G5W9_9ARCH|nr:hypothetical protein [uncultured marine thaumarchaeote AD1000_96_F07]